MSYLPILTYHRLLKEESSRSNDPARIAVSQNQFRRQLSWLKRLGYQTLSLTTYVQELRAGHAPKPKSFGITFDDGYEDVFTLGLPILRELGYTATVFAVPGEERNQWDNGSAKLLTKDQLHQWRKAGMEVGGHTCHHIHLPQADPDTARKEIRDAKMQLEDSLGEPISTFAYPYGESNPWIEEMVRGAGYEAAFVTDRGPRDHAESAYRLRRVVIFPSNGTWDVFWKVQRWYPLYQDWKRRRP